MSIVTRQRDVRVPLVALERQHNELHADLALAFERVLKNSSFILGEEVEQFEREFAGYCGVDECVGVASGTAALVLALRAAGIGPGDEVIVPAYTFAASAFAVAEVGATPVLCDVDDATALIDADAARAMMTARTAAVIAVHLYGQCCDMDAILDFARPAGLFVLEDAAQAHGAYLSSRRAGSLGDAACFSFYPSKNLGALGDAGGVCTDNAALAERVRQLRNLGQAKKGQFVTVSANDRLDGVQAAMLRVKLPHLDEWNAARRAIAREYRDGFGEIVRVVSEDPSSPSVHHVFAVRVPNRDDFQRRLNELGVGTGVHYDRTIDGHDVWAGREIRKGPTEHADAWAAEEISLPMHPGLDPSEIAHVIDAIIQAVAEMGSGG